ncbi:riboflavin kinase [Spiroplasma endosymbiont of Othius punctulatus]|uniref:riboflavin kinase n=1 Tax=Spiroplasma endosymbiont of Othius punctulatus TaxID=3066289 RepID=UPI0030D49F4E
MSKINVIHFSPLTKIMLWRENSIAAVGDWFNWSDQEDSLVKQLIKTARKEKKKSVIFVPITDENMHGFLVEKNLTEKAGYYKVDEIFFYYLHQTMRLEDDMIVANLNQFLKIDHFLLSKNFQLDHVFNEKWLEEHQNERHTFVPTVSGDKYIAKVINSLNTCNFKLFKKLTFVDFMLEGRVAEGTKKARTLGYPTANLKYDTKLPLKYGVYGVEVYIPHTDKTYNGYAFYISLNNDEFFVFETNIEKFNTEIYGWKLVVTPKIFVRENVPYTTDQNMIKLIQEDINKIKSYSKG